MVFLLNLCNNDSLRHLWRLVLETRMHRFPENLFLLILEQNQFSNKTIETLGPNPPFFYLRNFLIFTQILQKQPSDLRHLRWLVSETRMHGLPENMFLPILDQDQFIN